MSIREVPLELNQRRFQYPGEEAVVWQMKTTQYIYGRSTNEALWQSVTELQKGGYVTHDKYIEGCRRKNLCQDFASKANFTPC